MYFGFDLSVNDLPVLQTGDTGSGTVSTLLLSDGFAYDFGKTDGRGHAAGKASYINSVAGMGGDGLAYTSVNGAWKTTNGRATPRTLTTSPLYAHADAGQANVSVSAKIWRGAGAMGLVARWIDDNNYLYIRTDGSSLIMHERVSGTNTQVFSQAITYTAGGTILLELDGTAYTAYYEGVQVSSGTVNSALNAGDEVGPWTNNVNAGNEIDDLAVYVFPDVQVAADDLSSATITIGSTAELTSNLYMGATYTHNTFPSGGNATAVAAAKALLSTLGIIHIHLRHFGFSNNMSAQASGADEATRVTNTINGENISFTEHDAVMQLLADNGVTEVWLKAWGFPDWMLDTGSGSGASNQTFQTQYRAEAAAYVQAFIKRYNTDTTISGIKIIAVSFTHEEKGGYSSDNARTVSDFDAIAAAVKSQDATVTAHGPYSVPRGAGLVNFGYADSTDTREPLVAQDVTDGEYFLANSTGQDGLTFSMKSWVDAVTAPSYETVVKIIPYWGRLLDEFKRLTGYASESISADEFYAFNINDWSDYTDDQQAAIHAAALYYFVRHGGKYLAHWMIEAPQSERKYAFWNSTLDGPTLTTTPVYDVHQAYRDNFANNTYMLPTTIAGDTAGLLALAQTNKVLAINLRSASRQISVDNVSHTLSAYEAKVVDRPVQYLLRDDFTDTVLAGSVNGSRATSGPGTRSVTDAGSDVSISNNELSVDGGQLDLAYDDPYVRYTDIPVSRSAGRLLIARIKPELANTHFVVGLGSSTTQPATMTGVKFASGNRLALQDGITPVTTIAVVDVYPTVGTYQNWTFAMRATGVMLLRGTDLIYVSSTGTNTPLYPMTGNFESQYSIGFLRVPDSLWLPTPLVSDGAFGVTTDGLGHAEGIAGGIGAGGSGKEWTENKGAWSGGSANTLSGGEAIRTVDTSDVDTFVSLDITRTSGNASIMLRYTDDNNYLRCGTDGTNMLLVEKVSGTENTLLTTAITYSAGSTMKIRLEGQAARVYYNNLFVSSTGSISTALTGTRIGLYTTDTGNSFDNIVAYASTGYTELDKYVS